MEDSGRVNRVQLWRTLTPDKPPDPHTLTEGELAVEMASVPIKLWLGVPPQIDPNEQVLLGFGPGVGQSSATVSDTAPATAKVGDLWWCSADGNLYVWYDDASSQQWVVAVNTPAEPGGGGSGGGSGGISDAPADGSAYGRSNNAWTRVLKYSGDIVDGGNF